MCSQVKHCYRAIEPPFRNGKLACIYPPWNNVRPCTSLFELGRDIRSSGHNAQLQCGAKEDPLSCQLWCLHLSTPLYLTRGCRYGGSSKTPSVRPRVLLWSAFIRAVCIPGLCERSCHTCHTVFAPAFSPRLTLRCPVGPERLLVDDELKHLIEPVWYSGREGSS